LNHSTLYSFVSDEFEVATFMVGIEISFAQIVVRSIVYYEIWRYICVAHDGKAESLYAMVDVNTKPDLAISEIKRHVDTLWVASVVRKPGELSQQALLGISRLDGEHRWEIVEPGSGGDERPQYMRHTHHLCPRVPFCSGPQKIY
jgi:hypothetical protein